MNRRLRHLRLLAYACMHLILAIEAVICSSACFGQQIDIEKFSPRDGLLDRAVQSVCEDDQQKLWVATSEGLYVMVGSKLFPTANFTELNYSVSSYNTTNLVFDPSQHSIFCFCQTPENDCLLYQMLLPNTTRSEYALKTIRRWKGQTAGLYSVFVNGAIYCTIGKRLHRLHISGNGSVDDFIYPGTIFEVGQSTDGTIWGADTNYLYQVLPSKSGNPTLSAGIPITEKIFRELYTGQGRVRSIPFAHRLRLEIAALHPLYRRGHKVIFPELNSAKHALQTTDGSMILYGPLGISRLRHRQQPGIPFPANHEIRALMLNKEGKGIVGSSVGLFQVDAKRGISGNAIGGIRGYFVDCLPMNNSECLFFSVYPSSPSILIDTATEKFRALWMIDSMEIYSAHKSAESHRIFLGTNRGIYAAKIGKNQIITEHLKSEPEVSVQAMCDVVSDNAASGLLYGGPTGLFYLAQGSSNGRKILNESVTSIIRIGKYYLIATLKKGIFIINRQFNLTAQLDESNGLENNSVFSIAYDPQKKILWLGTAAGLCAYHLPSGLARALTRGDGLPHDEQNRKSIQVFENGFVASGSLTGLAWINTKSLFPASQQDLSWLKAFAYQTTNVKQQKTEHLLGERTSVVLDRYVKKLILRVTTPPKYLKLGLLFYRIDNGSWTNLPADGTLEILELRPGTHTIQLKSGWEYTPTPHKIFRYRVEAAWYEHPLSKIAIVLLSLALTLVQIVKIHKKRLERRYASDLNKNRERMFSIVAHDLRTPMKAYLGIADLLKSLVQKEDWTGVTKIANHIDSSARNMELLLDNLLNWSLIELDSLDPTKETVDVTKMLRLLLPMYDTYANQKGLKLETELPDNMKVDTNANLLGLIIRNLIDNAVKYATGGTVECRIRNTPKYCEIYTRNLFESGHLDRLVKLKHNMEQDQSSPSTGIGVQFIKKAVRILDGTAHVIINEHTSSLEILILLPNIKNTKL